MSFIKVQKALASLQLSQLYFQVFKDENLEDSLVETFIVDSVSVTANKLAKVIPNENHRAKFITTFKNEVAQGQTTNNLENMQTSFSNNKKILQDLRWIRILINDYKCELLSAHKRTEPFNLDSWLKQLQKLEMDFKEENQELTDDLCALLDNSQLTDLAYDLRDQEKYTKALELYEKIYDRQLSKLGPEHETTLYTQFQMATCHGYLKDYNKALDLYRMVLEKRNSVLGPNHEGTLRTQHNIALIFQGQGKHSEALELYEKLYERRNSTLGPNHLDTIKTQFQMALCFDDLKDYCKALELYTLVFEKRNKILGPNDRDTWMAPQNMAWVLQNQGKYGESLKLYQKVYEKKVEFLGHNHPSTLHTKRSIDCVSKEGNT